MRFRSAGFNELATRQLASYNQPHMPRNRACGKGKLYGADPRINPVTPAAGIN